MTQAAAIPLDMFTTIIAVHWPDNDITKLDFVGHRYMVRSKDQEYEDVLGDGRDDGLNWTPPAEQRSWRTDAGLDLRIFDSFGLSTGVRTAYLKNKTAEPDKKNPGALNEFLYNVNRTMVMEFDWVDVVAAVEEQSPGGHPDGLDLLYDLFMSADVVNSQYWEISNTERQQDREQRTVASMHWVYVWTGAHYGAVPVFDIGTEADWGGSYPPPRQAVEILPSNYPIPGDAPDDYPYPETSWYLYGSVPNGPYTIQPELAVYDFSVPPAPPPNGRIIGANVDTAHDSYAPMTRGDGILPAPYGRVRIAINLGDEDMAVSVNGGPVVVLRREPLFTRQPPIDPDTNTRFKYFPVTDYLSNHRSYEVFFSMPGIVRCVWLYRKKKRNKTLQSLSVVRPLTPPDSPKWKTT